MLASDEKDFYELNYFKLSENFVADMFLFLKKQPPLIYIVLLIFCLSLLIVSLGEIQTDMVNGFLSCTEPELLSHADCTTKLEESAVVKEEDEIVEDSSQKINLLPIFIKTTINLPSHEEDDDNNNAKDDQRLDQIILPNQHPANKVVQPLCEYKHGQHDVQMDSDDEVSMGDEDDQSNYHRRFDGDAIRSAVEEARLAVKRRTEEAIARTKARADVLKNRRYFLLRNSV